VSPASQSTLREWGPRVAPLVLGAAVLVVGHECQSFTPSEVRFELALGPAHHDVTRVTLAFESDQAPGSPMSVVDRRWTDGAPPELVDSVELPPGEYTVEIALVNARGSTLSRRARLHAPAEGRVRLHTEEAQ
jgi:hypothetical protein